MPNINDIAAKRKKKAFVKKEFRPWNLTGEAPTNETPPTTNSIERESVSQLKTSVTDNTLSNTIKPAVPKRPQVIKDNIEKKPASRKSNSIINANFNHKETPNKTNNLGTELGTNLGTELGTQKNTNATGNFDLGTNLGTNLGTENVHLSINRFMDLSATPYTRDYNALTGIAKNIVTFVYEACLIHHTRETGPVHFANLVSYCNKSINSVRVAKKRLIKEGLLITKHPEGWPTSGRNTCLIYTLSDKLFNELHSLYNHSTRNTVQQDLGTNLGTELGTTPLNNNNNLNIIIKMSGRWLELDYTNATGIGPREILNIRKKNPEITVEDVQRSIHAFAWTLTHNKKQFKPNDKPAGIFVRQLQQGVLWEEVGYKTPEEQQQNFERKSRLDNMNQQKESQFDEYFHNLCFEERDKLVSLYPEAKNETGYDNETLRREVIDRKYIKRHYDNNIWPKLVEKELEELI